MAWNADVPGQRDRPHHQYHLHLHLLDAARALMLLGAVAAVSTVGGNPDADGDAAQVLLGFVTWLLGVCLLSFVPLLGRFPQADALAGAAIANASAVLGYLFTPWN
jgi:hypothetical protein